jgi:hypothetical protein
MLPIVHVKKIFDKIKNFKSCDNIYTNKSVKSNLNYKIIILHFTCEIKIFFKFCDLYLFYYFSFNIYLNHYFEDCVNTQYSPVSI